jgi:hypothetical protein
MQGNMVHRFEGRTLVTSGISTPALVGHVIIGVEPTPESKPKKELVP